LRLAHPEQVATAILPLMDGFGAPWCVAGGWALDLFLGYATRPHADLELAVFRQDQSLLQPQLQGWTFTASVNGRREAWQQGERLELPVHEIHAHSPGEPRLSIEFLLNERDEVNWVFRRNPAIVLPLDRAIVNTEFGVNVLSPEIVLLFKAKFPRTKDEADYDATRATMSDERRRWLRSALLTCDPDHPWIPQLEPSTA
jgi:hypothetical protein